MGTKIEKTTPKKTASADALAATKKAEIELREDDLTRVAGGMLACVKGYKPD